MQRDLNLYEAFLRQRGRKLTSFLLELVSLCVIFLQIVIWVLARVLMDEEKNGERKISGNT